MKNPPMILSLLLLSLVCPIGASESPEPRPNRLIDEKSPYLLEHALNPVDWFPWGEEAFEKARLEDKPIFLSVGYSTCHWCHVMAKESFVDRELAAIINEHFVPVKVDREERPDIDAVYQAFLSATGGDGGWPATVFLTPELEPFFGGTYFPPRDRDGRIGLETVLLRLADSWTNHREQIEATGRQMTTAIESLTAPAETDAKLGQSVVDRAHEQLARRYDPTFGGFSPAPKFPQPVIHELLLRHHARAASDDAARMSLDTLRMMATGGIYDQLDGGFHRYSVDERWIVPHFEKMLYDQAQLASVYLSAYQLTGEETFAAVARGTLDFVLSAMTSPLGGFTSALDASSLPSARSAEEIEGAYYTWSWQELEKAIGSENLQLAARAFGARPEGNVVAELDPSGEMKGRNVLSRRVSAEVLAKDFDLSVKEVDRRMRSIGLTLQKERVNRPAPQVDDKILASWNGLMISAFARGAQVFAEPRYAEAAIDAAQFVGSEMIDGEEMTLWRRWREGETAVPGFAEDYAFLIQGLLDLWETTFDLRWLELAAELQRTQDRLFWNDERGYYSLTRGDETILMDVPGDSDSVLPSHNSVSALNLRRLAMLHGNEAWEERSSRVIRAFGQGLSTNPQTMPLMVSALSASLSKPKQIIIAGRRDAEDTNALIRLVHERYLPDRLLILADGGELQEALTRKIEILEYITPIDGRATAYVCENFVCKLPSNDPAAVASQLDAGKGEAGNREQGSGEREGSGSAPAGEPGSLHP